MTRREFAQVPAALAAQSAPPPNILFVMPDQWRGMDLGSQGAQVRTPNLDRLAARGVQFDNAVANTPVCSPARASLLTGQYAHSVDMAVNDLPLDDRHPTIAKILAKAGYYTGFVGKWHLHGGPRMPGYVPPERRQGYEFWAASICNHSYFEQVYFRDSPEPIRMPGYESYGWTELAIEFIEKAKLRRQPWFLSLQQGPPHDPYLWPPGFEKSYDPAAIAMRPNWSGGAKIAGAGTIGTRQHIAAYYAAIEALDREVGKLLEKIDSNTLVLFLSDHGDMLGSQNTALKRKPWEESCRVPLIFSGPGIPQGWRTPQPISHIDLVPTMLGFAGQKPTPEMPGCDFSNFIRTRGRSKPKDLPKHSMLMSHSMTEARQFDPWRGLRTTRWKYARFENKPWVLYDLAADPFERTNLIGEARHAKLMAGFDREIETWQRHFNDSWAEQVDWRLRERVQPNARRGV
ncbi:MAG: sulfatase [Bryobacteraceae bacterium]|nr:sulfatase [Bryobacteraceae bacterium]